MRAGEPLGEVLNFLLQLGFREVGAPFAASTLRAPERGIAADLAQLGLLLPFRRAYIMRSGLTGQGLGLLAASLAHLDLLPLQCALVFRAITVW